MRPASGASFDTTRSTPQDAAKVPEHPMTRIVQISDTHLSPGKRHFHANSQPLLDWLKESHADLVIHTGDVTVDGADVEEDMRYCAEIMDSIGLPYLAVPGNHDVGEPKHPYQPVNAERLARWRRHFGPDWWHRDIEGWRLIGLDSMLFGSDEPAETEQMAWLESAMREASGRRIGWFTHRPLFIGEPREGDVGYWAPTPVPRARLLDLVRRFDVAFVASGHLHKLHDSVVDNVRYLWAPSSGFVVDAHLQPEGMAGEAVLGALVYEFSESGFTVMPAEIPGLTPFFIGDVLDEVYPPR
ncbi:MULTISPECIES: metallophosphoesterase [unclassified Mesorhizobium]|uniref:metallophosphoesterase family protein n=1 Tax=unclassified Mesorhizobium TaxID=325217 RepID=UPI001CC916E9|nr:MULTISPECIES: metallophosphoesterase [unclassified Mesorhizobium]MBZ9966576.1 metallophosphoesterase [Mesorhizobium sp. BR1-1-2]